MKEKVVLAYSGGLDTTAIIPWLKETFDYEVICCCIDCGQGEELDGLDERAKLSGASKLYIENIVDEFADDFIMPCVKAGAVYENKYLLGTSMARPVIAKKLVEIARKEGAVAICHGATGKGNDQIRFELSIKALAPVFPKLNFMPTGGVNTKNLMDYLGYDRIFACGGTWMVKKDLIEGEKWDEITRICKDAVKTMLGFELRHVGINCADEAEAERTAQMFSTVFGWEYKPGNSPCSPARLWSA